MVTQTWEEGAGAQGVQTLINRGSWARGLRHLEATVCVRVRVRVGGYVCAYTRVFLNGRHFQGLGGERGFL